MSKGMQVHFMVLSVKPWTQIHVLETKKRRCSLTSLLNGYLFYCFNTLVFNFGLLNKSYQMNPANYREALVEAREDEAEGADILLVSFSFLF